MLFIRLLIVTILLLSANCAVAQDTYKIIGMGGGIKHDMSAHSEVYLYWSKNKPGGKWRDFGFGVSYDRFKHKENMGPDVISNGFSLFVDYNHSLLVDWFYLGGRWSVIGAQWFDSKSDDILYSRGDSADGFLSMGIHLQGGVVKSLGRSAALRLRVMPGWYFFSPGTYTDEDGYNVSKGTLPIKTTQFTVTTSVCFEFSF